MSTPNNTRNRSNGSRPQDAPKVPEVYTFTLPEELGDLGTNVTFLDVTDLPRGMYAILLSPQDMYLSSTGKSVLTGNVKFKQVDRDVTLSLTITRPPTAADRRNEDLTNPNSK